MLLLVLLAVEEALAVGGALAAAGALAVAVAAALGAAARVAAALALGCALTEGEAEPVSALETEALAGAVPLAESQGVLVAPVLPEALAQVVAETVGRAVALALSVGVGVALCEAEGVELALARADLEAGPARVKLGEGVGGAVRALVAEEEPVPRGEELALKEALGEDVEVRLLVGLCVVLAVAHSVAVPLALALAVAVAVGRVLPLPVAAAEAVGEGEGVVLPEARDVTVRVALEVEEGLPLSVPCAGGDAVATLRVPRGVGEGSAECDGVRVSLGLALTLRLGLGEGETEVLPVAAALTVLVAEQASGAPGLKGQRVALTAIEAVAWAVRDTEPEPLGEPLALPLRVAELLPRPVPQGSGVRLTVGEKLPVTVTSSVPVATGLLLEEALGLAQGEARAVPKAESVAPGVSVSVAHALGLSVTTPLLLAVLEAVAQAVEEADADVWIEKLREGVLASVPEGVKVTVGEAEAEGEPETQRVTLRERLCVSVCVGHWLLEGEPVWVRLPVGLVVRLPAPLGEGDCEAHSLAAGDWLPLRLPLAHGEAEADSVPRRLALVVGVASALPVRALEPEAEEQGEGLAPPPPPPVLPLGLCEALPLVDGAAEGDTGELVADRLPLADGLGDCDCEGHWLLEGEPVAERVALGERDWLPVPLLVRDCRGVAVAPDALPRRVLLTDTDQERLLEGVGLPRAVPEGEGEPMEALGLAEVLPLAEGDCEWLASEFVAEWLALSDRLGVSDCVGHWLLEGEPVGERLPLVDRE